MRDTNTHYGDQVTRAMNRPFLTAAILLSFLTATISAQDLERHDTLTAAIKTDSRRVAEASLLKGGFEGSSSNFTAGHLKITTKDPNRENFRMSAALNNFLASISMESPISKNTSFLLSARISPLAWEYKAVRGMLPSLLGGFDNFGAGVGDVYGKFRWQTGKRSVLNG